MSNKKKQPKHVEGVRGQHNDAAKPQKRKGDAAPAKREAYGQRDVVAVRIASRKPKVRFAVIALCCVAALVAAAGIGAYVTQGSPGAEAEIEANQLSISGEPDTDVAEGQPNPIDFAKLMGQNNDLYAWLYVPGTNVNEPVMQSTIADNYYLYRNALGEDDIAGTPYTQTVNSKEFTDSVTVVYGHTFPEGDANADDAFGTLHRFEEPSFLASHPVFYIYTPQAMYIYKVVSAYTGDNSHILNSHDFSDLDVVQDYLDMVIDPEQSDAVVAEGAERMDAQRARIVQLSTCTRPADDNRRFIVTGLLTDVTPLAPSW